MSAPAVCGTEVVERLRRAGVGPGDQVALVAGPGVGLGLSAGRPGSSLGILEGGASVVGSVEEALRPRWVLWSAGTTAILVEGGVRIGRCWDIAAVHRVLFGGWRADPAQVWARLGELAVETIPTLRSPDLFNQADQHDIHTEDPVGADGHLRPEWASGGWSASPDRLARWADLALTVVARQQRVLAELGDRPKAGAVLRSESAAELLCVELSVDGLPMNRGRAEDIVGRFIGPRPRDEIEAGQGRARRDAEVLRHAPPGPPVDLRSPGQVKALLGRVGVDVVDTRAWRLRELQEAHPLVGAVLAWRKVERIATTYGYRWLDEHLGADGRLRGAWTGCDGAAGRMTASAGLHNMPADLRAAVAAEDGHIFVRADLGQIEPRVLAAVSQDAALGRASDADDMYAPVADQLRVDRAVAKVAVLGAMYGQTTGHGAQALRRLKDAYPVAMAYLDEADRLGRAGRDLRTYGGRLIPMGSGLSNGRPVTPAQAAARGRYGRNAMIQGAAAELFKMWAVIVRARLEPLPARIVLCLHDELLVHTPVEHGDAVSRLLDACLDEAVGRWAPDRLVRFVAEISVVERWSDAKG